MTNDDRSNDDRTADGRTPSWGQPQGDTPRYGERITPASAPQYGEQQHDQPRWGEQQHEQQQYGQQPQQQYGQQPQQNQYDQQQYGQPQQQYGQPQYGAAPASSGGPAWQAHDAPRPKKPTVGRIAAVLAVSALVIGVITGFLFGSAIVQSGAFRELMQNGGSTAPDPSQFSGMENDPGFAASGLMFLFGTIVGLWALVQGIVAIATKRGRGAGVFAVIVAVVGVIAVFVVYGIVAAAAYSSGS